MAAIALGVGSLLSGVSAIGGLFGGSPASNVPMPEMWKMPNMDNAAGGAFGGIGGLAGMNYPGALMPAYQQQGNALMNNPYAGGYQNATNATADAGFNFGSNAMGLGNMMSGASLSALPQMGALFGAGNQALGTIGPTLDAAFDPQNALYNRTAQRLTDQTRAGLSSRGVNMTPYGAGIEGQNLSNFNIDWNNNQLQRMLGGISGMGSAMGSAGNAIGGGMNVLGGVGQGLTTGNNLGAGGLSAMTNSAMMPYSAFNTIGQNNMGTLGQLSGAGMQATQIPQQVIQDYLNYLSTGNQSAGINNQTAQVGLNQANMGFNQSQMMGNQLGGSLAGMGRAFGGGGASPWNFGSSFGGGASPWNFGSSFGGGSGGVYPGGGWGASAGGLGGFY